MLNAGLVLASPTDLKSYGGIPPTFCWPEALARTLDLEQRVSPQRQCRQTQPDIVSWKSIFLPCRYIHSSMLRRRVFSNTPNSIYLAASPCVWGGEESVSSRNTLAMASARKDTRERGNSARGRTSCETEPRARDGRTSWPPDFFKTVNGVGFKSCQGRYKRFEQEIVLWGW